MKLESALRHEDWEIEELKIRTTINTQACNDNFFVLVSARLSEKWQSKTLFSWKKISLPDAQIS